MNFDPQILVIIAQISCYSGHIVLLWIKEYMLLSVFYHVLLFLVLSS